MPLNYEFFLNFVIRVPAILIALTIHEIAHGYAAKALGDNTAKNAGRLTLNPFAHVDLFGALMLLLGPFGWAKPVPVNPFNFANPKKDMALVALAGPLSNITTAALAGMFFRLNIVAYQSIMWTFLFFFIMINIGLAIFNMLPVYPLDGSRILMAFLNRRQNEKYLRAMSLVPMVFLGLIIFEHYSKVPILSRILIPIIKPIFNLCIGK